VGRTLIAENQARARESSSTPTYARPSRRSASWIRATTRPMLDDRAPRDAQEARGRSPIHDLGEVAARSSTSRVKRAPARPTERAQHGGRTRSSRCSAAGTAGPSRLRRLDIRKSPVGLGGWASIISALLDGHRRKTEKQSRTAPARTIVSKRASAACLTISTERNAYHVSTAGPRLVRLGRSRLSLTSD
jgi:hypothetical protein